MAEEFEGLDRLKKLKADAKRAASVLDEAERDESDLKNKATVIEIARPTSHSTPVLQTASREPQHEVALQPMSLSTLVLAATKKRLARAAHLQAAVEQRPNTQWEIVDEAINEWCKSRGY
jgi:hypothetical protein